MLTLMILDVSAGGNGMGTTLTCAAATEDPGLMDEIHAFSSTLYVPLWAERFPWVAKPCTFGFRISDELWG